MELFGTDGIRGRVGQEPITYQDAHQIGMAAAAQLNLEGGRVLIAGDTRASSPELMEAIAEGIAQLGGRVELLDTFTTPGLGLRVAQTDAAAGVMITASHNKHSKDDPRQRWNGIKILGSDGHKVPDADQEGIEALYGTLIPYSNHNKGEIRSGARDEHVAAYLAHLIGLVDGRQIFSDMSIGLDTAHGAATKFAPELVAMLGGAAKLKVIGGKPDGWNINDGYGATHTEAISGLVTAHKLDLGAAFDGDADRMLGADQYGRLIDGDMAVYVGARVRNLARVAMTIMANGGVIRGLENHGIGVAVTPVGDRHIVMEIDKSRNTPTPITYGGEQSGHIVDTEVGPIGDGMGTLVRLVDAAQRSGRSLTEWRTEFEELLLPQTLSSPRVTDKVAALQHPEVVAFLGRAQQRVGTRGRVISRMSGTGDEIRLLVEHDDPVVVKDLIEEFNATVASTGLAA
jgi:phosphoglucosamine mutase